MSNYHLAGSTWEQWGTYFAGKRVREGVRSTTYYMFYVMLLQADCAISSPFFSFLTLPFSLTSNLLKWYRSVRLLSAHVLGFFFSLLCGCRTGSSLNDLQKYCAFFVFFVAADKRVVYAWWSWGLRFPPLVMLHWLLDTAAWGSLRNWLYKTLSHQMLDKLLF